jgi:hypothetical protein
MVTAKSEFRTVFGYFRILAGAACCALRREDINALFGSLGYDSTVALK